MFDDYVYPYEFNIYNDVNFSIMDWFEDFIKRHPTDAIFDVIKDTYIDIGPVPGMFDKRNMVTVPGYVKIQFRHESDALAFKIKFGIHMCIVSESYNG